MHTLAILGFGEAGFAIAAGLAARNGPALRIRAFDPRFAGREGADVAGRAREAGVEPCADVAAALAGAELVLALVPAGAVEEAARSAAPHLGAGAFYVDLASVGPATKRRVAAIVETAGARFVEGAIMARVPGLGHRVPLLLAGRAAEDCAKVLSALGMRVEVAGSEPGQAAATKMARSVVVKGLEALLAEALGAARRAGVEGAVLDSLARSFPGLDWRALATSHLGRVRLHGPRRVAEMEEAAATLAELGFEPHMARAAARAIGAAHARLAALPDTRADDLDALLDALAGTPAPEDG